ncbi:efflux transporter outer membrane subunit [Limibacter armeniacum]|uniref:efflux transporter outer membrane subunit n=1 Tax=Limibacter armeniacum TaxID=466084 RepID=UPI002FE598AC
MNYKILRVLATVSVALLAQSCFVAKKYEGSQLDTSKLYRVEDIQLNDSTSIANIQWGEFFTDPYLLTLLDSGLQNNQNIQIAIENINVAQSYYKQGKAALLPSVSLGPSATYTTNSEHSQIGEITGMSNTTVLELYQLSANLSWEIDIWGKLSSQKRAAYASYLQTEAAQRAVQTQLVASIASSYYQLLALDAQIKVTEETVSNREKSIKTINSLKASGNVTEVSVKQNEAQLYTSQAILVDLKRQRRVLENTLCLLIGEAPHAIERGVLADQQIETNLSIGVPSQLLQNRPDVTAAEYGLVNAFELTNVARSSFYPSLTITATGGYQSLGIDNLFNPGSIFTNLVAGLTQPIFNKRLNKTRLEVAKAQQKQALLRFEQSLLTAGNEVSNALYSYETSTEKLVIKEKELDALRKAAKYSEVLLENGATTYLEVLVARDQALSSELNTIDSKYQQLNSIITLYKALGGGASLTNNN